MSARAQRPWVCRKCGHRNERGHVKCRGERSAVIGTVGTEACDARRPKRPVRAHQRALTDNTYAHFVQVAADIHGVTDESCCVCGKPRSQDRHHDRDHDHRTGRARGLACGGNQGCNVLMLPWITASVARAIAQAKALHEEPDALRWIMIAEYLERVEQHYAEQSE